MVMVDPPADDTVGVFSWNAVAVSLQMNQTGAGDAGQQFHITVKRTWHGHELGLLVLQYVSHFHRRVLRMI